MFEKAAAAAATTSAFRYLLLAPLTNVNMLMLNMKWGGGVERFFSSVASESIIYFHPDVHVFSRAGSASVPSDLLLSNVTIMSSLCQ